MSTFIWVQILGAITLMVAIIAFQQKKKSNLLLLTTLGFALFIVQYLLTNKITGAALFVIVTLRGLVYFYCERKELKPSVVVLVTFQLALIFFALYTWQNALSILPFIAAFVGGWAFWQDNMMYTRRALVFMKTCMLVYNLSAGMFTGALTSTFELSSVIVAICRYDKKSK